MKHLIIALFSALSLYAPSNLSAQIPVINGWSQFTASDDTRLIYVSDQTGNDATAQFYLPNAPEVGSDPFLPTGSIAAYKTIAAAKAQVRSGKPDWILFKRGETWTNQQFGVVEWQGRSAAEPLLIAAYGDCGARPGILTGSASLISFSGLSASHVAMVGLYARPHTYVGVEEPVAVRLIDTPFQSFLLEDCHFEYFSTHLVVHNLPSYSTHAQNLTVRRNQLTHAFHIGGSGGLFIANVNGILFEENLIDHNGWNEAIAGAESTAFTHNTYFQVSNRNLVFKNNIVARAGAIGGGFRCGGDVQNNLFLSNPKNIQFGTQESVNGIGGGLNWPSEYVSGRVENNVVLDTRVEPYEPGTGIQVQRAKSVNIERNIVAHFSQPSNYNYGVILNEVGGADFQHNVLYNISNNNTAGNAYGNALLIGSDMIDTNDIRENQIQLHHPRSSCVGQNADFARTRFRNNHYFNVLSGGFWYEQWFQPQGSYNNWLLVSGETGSSDVPIDYPAADRSIQSYLNTIGLTGDLDSFLTRAANNSRCYWDTNFLASSVNNYIREGFGLSATSTTQAPESSNSGWSLQLFPNPATDFIELRPPNVAIQYAEVVNGQGQVIRHLNTPFQGVMSLVDIPPGLYWVRVYHPSGVICKAFVKI
jgi:hypothetical protein